jgi:adenylate cyclase
MRYEFRLWILMLLFSTIAIASLAQTKTNHFSTKNLDSLVQVNKDYLKEDQHKLSLLIAIASLYEGKNPSKGIEAAAQAIELGLKLGQDAKVQLLLAEAYNINGINHAAKSDYLAAGELYEKALAINQKLDNKYGMAYNQLYQSKIYYVNENQAKAKELCESSLKIFESLDDKNGIAKSKNSIGNIYLGRNEFLKAIAYFEQALSIFKQLNIKSGIAGVYGNLGLVYEKQANYPKSLEYYQMALKLNEQIGSNWQKAGNLGNIGLIYSALSDDTKAIEHHNKALIINEQLGNKEFMSANLNNIGSIVKSQNKSLEALSYFQKSQAICEEIGNLKGLSACLGNIGGLYLNFSDQDCSKLGIKPFDKYLKAIEYCQRAIKINEQIGHKNYLSVNLSVIGRIYYYAPDSVLNTLGVIPADRYNKALEYFQKAHAINKEISNLDGEKNSWLTLSIVYKKQGDFKNAYEAYRSYIDIRDSIEGVSVRKQITRKEMQFEFAKKEDSLRFVQQLTNEQLEKQRILGLQQSQQLQLQTSELALATKDKELQYLAFLKEQAEKQNLAKQKKIEAELKTQEINILQKQNELAKVKASRSLGINVGLGSALIGILFVTYAFFIQNKKKEKLNLALYAEKEKSDNLLLNILPEEIASELKETGKTEAKLFQEVSVLFTDFVGFTSVSERLSPTELVSEIHKNFTAFDAIIEKFGLEKIKTIGDAYLAVCGLPNPNKNHASQVIKAAIEIRDYMLTQNNSLFQIRIGIHSGPVVAGIVGVKKYAYDIWGDTVNTAARMEQNSEPGKINISGDSYEQVKNIFSFEHRGKIAAKNKGDIDMYFVNQI